MSAEQQVLNVVEKIVKDPSFFPDPTTYMNTALNVYRLSTGQDPLSVSNWSPFENLYSIVTEKVTDLSRQLFSDCEDENLRNYLKTFIRRTNFLDHVFEYIQKHRTSFVHFRETPTLSDILCKQFLGLVAPNGSTERVANLTQMAIDEMEQIFEEKDVSCDVLHALFFIHSRACIQMPYTFTFDIFRARFFKCCGKHTDVQLEKLPHVVREIAHIVEYLDSNDKDVIRGIVSTVLLTEPRIKEIKDCLLESEESLKELLKSNSWKTGLLTVLSFANNGQQALKEIHEKFVLELTNGIQEKETSAALTTELIEILRTDSNFIGYLYEPSHGYEKMLKAELSRVLNEIAFPVQVGGKIPHVLAHITDGALKRGSTTRKLLTNENIATLLSYVYDRDLFLQTYGVYLFQRLGTRSTRGLSEEKAVLNQLAGVVMEINLKKLRDILDHAQEHTDPAAPKFSYILLRKSDIHQRQSLTTFRPKPYCALVDTVTKNLQTQNPNHMYTWMDHMATAEVKIKLGARISSFVVSLLQYGLIEMLSQHQVVSGVMLNDLHVEEGRIKQAIMPLIKAKLVAIVSGSMTEMGSAQFRLNLERPASPTGNTVILADNWSFPVKTRNPDVQSRTEATQAMIVRIMKTKKMVKKQQLLELVMTEAANIFPVTVAGIQKAVETLLAKEYLEEKDSEYLIYVE